MMDSTNDFSSIDVVVDVYGKDVKLCVEYWVDDYDYGGYGEDCYYIIETVNGLPSDMFTWRTIDNIIEEIVDTIANENADLACSNLMCNEDY